MSLMWHFRWLRILARGLLRSVQLAPAVLLLAAILVDEGPTGEARASSHFFPLVLWLFDDFAWTCARNSVSFALAVSIISLVLGVGLRRALERVWPRARPALAASALAVVAISPAFLRLGSKVASATEESGLLPLESMGAGSPGASLESWSGILLWLTWINSAVTPGAAFVALACASSFRRLDPAEAEAARLAGASSLRIARDLSWPIVRPAAVRAAGLVFLIALVEPGAPLVLGLRRTLAFQIVDAATGASPFPRGRVGAHGRPDRARWLARFSVEGTGFDPRRAFEPQPLPGSSTDACVARLLLCPSSRPFVWQCGSLSSGCRWRDWCG